jgi:aminoglycoside phosphotransferase (APT) family kinase protein
MSAQKMHADEVHTDESLVRRLLAAQFPQWAALPIGRVESYGTDHAIYRLGDEMAVRLPRIEWATGQVDKEQRWLPLFAPRLPLAVPVPLAVGEPGEGYPWRWCVAPWLPGDNPTPDSLADLRQAALDIAAFLRALRRIDATGAPRAGRRNFYRGVPLAVRDEHMRATITALDGEFDSRVRTQAWEMALAAPAWDGLPVWLHGDLTPGNLLAVDGRLSAVIDFGCLGAGDPAADLIVAWNLLCGESHDAFRDAMGADDAMWARGMGWALTSLGGIAYYRDTNPDIVARARRQVAEVLADLGLGPAP